MKWQTNLKPHIQHYSVMWKKKESSWSAVQMHIYKGRFYHIYKSKIRRVTTNLNNAITYNFKKKHNKPLQHGLCSNNLKSHCWRSLCIVFPANHLAIVLRYQSRIITVNIKTKSTQKQTNPHSTELKASNNRQSWVYSNRLHGPKNKILGQNTNK